MIGFIVPLGFLNIFVYEAEESSTLLGRVDVSQLTPAWNSQTICPPRSVKPRFMSVVGTGGVSFAVDLSQNPSEVMLDIPQTVDVKSTKAIVFPFNPPKDISDRQLDITVTSTSKIPAYLKVSQVRQDVDENIEVVDYKKASLRLSFATKGRITLSKVSEPPLTDSISSWFIGIALKNSTGSLKQRETKKVTLTLSQSFDYSYAGPLCALFFVSLVLGILMSGLAMYLFKEYLVEVNIPESLVIVNVSNRNQGIQSSNGQHNSNNSQSNKCVRAITFIFAMMKVTYSCWFSGGPKTYSYATGVVGFVLMVGACQFVIANWYIMIQEGDRDGCFYNDFCYRVSDYHDIPLNLMISNLTYIVHALILTVCVLYMETKLYLFCENLEKSVTSSNNVGNCQSSSSGCQVEALPNHVFVCPNITPHLQQGAVPKHTLGDKEKKKLMARALKRKYSYSIGYAFAWALLFEGLFSLLYHLCPSRYTFQFDSAFMFVIAGLTVLLVYNGMELSECPVYQAEQQPRKQHKVEAHPGKQHQVEANSEEKQPEVRSAEQPRRVEDVKVHFRKQHPVEAHPGEQHQVEANSEEKQPVERSVQQRVLMEVKEHFRKQHPVKAHPGEQHQIEANSEEKQPVERSVEQRAGREVKADLRKQHPVEAHPGEQHRVETNAEEKQPVERSAEQHPVEELSVGALNFFLYFIVPLFIFNYLGTLYHSESGLVIALQVLFFIALVFWWLAMGWWAFHKLAHRKGVLPLGTCEGDNVEMGWNLCYYICGCGIAPIVLFLVIFLLMDLSQVFLFTCIFESVWALCAKTKLPQKLCALLCRFCKCFWKCLCECLCCTCEWTECCSCNCHCTCLEFFQGLYIFFTVAILAAAIGVFQGLQTTDKTASPEDSRDHNKECGILGFFDWHDLWHFLSSFALLMGAFVIMFISGEPKNGKTARWNGASESAGRENAGANLSADENDMETGT